MIQYKYAETFIDIVHNIFRSEILQLIFIIYLDPQVISFQSDLRGGHASFSRFDKICFGKKRSIAFEAQTTRHNYIVINMTFVTSAQRIMHAAYT